MSSAIGTNDSEASPRVGIGLPVHNGARFVGETIESVLSQTLGDVELIISDNASTDRTREICEEFARADERVRYHRQAENIGGSPNFNFVYGLARGDFFKWAPHDDVLHPEYLEACVSVLESNPSAVLCQSILQYIDEQGKELGEYSSDLRGSSSFDPATRFAAVVLSSHPAYEVMGVFRREALLGSLLMASFHLNDHALLAEVALRGRFVQVGRPLIRVRDHPDRYTSTKFRPSERREWHDPRSSGRISLPTWQLYSELVRMVSRNVSSGRVRTKCYAHLLRWWVRNWNAARMAVDLLAVPFPGIVEPAERLKQKLFSPAAGHQEVRRRG